MTTHHRANATLAAVAALALAATPITASARPLDVNNNSPVVSAPTAGSSNTSVPPILPQVDASQLARTEQGERQASAYAPPKGAQYSNAETNAYGAGAARHTRPGVVTVATPQVGFDWGDAGIGAAAGFALSTVALGGALVISQRRARRSHHTTALPS